ncbi:MAG: hypothetical protein ABIM42_03240 [candidate division WOR-3 bacterium]
MDGLNYSRWNLSYELNSNNIILFNTLSTSCMILKKGVFSSLRAGELGRLDSELFRELARNGFLFEGGDEAEKSAYWSFLQKIKYYSILESLHVCIVPSYKCNLRCIYFFEPIEALSEINSILNFEMLEPFLERLENTFKYSNLRVVLYGGEPLYNRNFI